MRQWQKTWVQLLVTLSLPLLAIPICSLPIVSLPVVVRLSLHNCSLIKNLQAILHLFIQWNSPTTGPFWFLAVKTKQFDCGPLINAVAN